MPTFAEIPLGVLWAADNPSSFLGFGSLFPLVIIFVLFYFMLIRPERRRRAELNQLLGNLKKNDRVVTVGGIIGTIVNVQKDSDEVTLKVDENTNTKLRVVRSSIARVVRDDEGDTKKAPSK